MRLRNLEINGFKSFAQKTVLDFKSPIVCIVGPNGSGKSNVVEAFRFVLGEQSMKSMRGKLGLDLIFKGSKNLAKSSRAGVTIYFNNDDKVFKLINDEGENVNLNYETLSVSREVYADGVNKYILNGSEVRLKDINNLLSSVNIGSSGHHIISQGEADRILNASQKDLREMIEDALGLKIYQYKVRDSVRKLERSEENMKEVTMLRRENAPHLNFLKKQMEKIEKVKEMREELLNMYLAYFKQEEAYLDSEHGILSKEKEKITAEFREIKHKISKSESDDAKVESKYTGELSELERKANDSRVLRGELERKLGRIEGMIEIKQDHKTQNTVAFSLPPAEVEKVFGEIGESVERALLEENIPEIRNILKRIQGILRGIKETTSDSTHGNLKEEIAELDAARSKLLAEIKNLEAKEEELKKEAATLREKMNMELESLRESEREKFALKVREQELSSALSVLNIKIENLNTSLHGLTNEKREGVALVGDRVLEYKNFASSEVWPRERAEEERKKIERIKIKLEDAGVGNSEEISKEFVATLERDQFLEREIADLEKSIVSLNTLIKELKEKIDEEFKSGVKKINKEFQEFFALLFNGGNASLSIVKPEKKKKKDLEDEDMDDSVLEETEEEEEVEEGAEISVSLPQKKVKELHALSGGERSLTSIALLFAMSQVNPPPFLILDETDAALDEANSKKFGDMVERLSKHSQLIVVTHNRETMSRAGMLYGVTIGHDGASKLLSVKFEEALAVAK